MSLHKQHLFPCMAEQNSCQTLVHGHMHTPSSVLLCEPAPVNRMKEFAKLER